jgi:hypothetical protein
MCQVGWFLFIGFHLILTTDPGREDKRAVRLMEEKYLFKGACFCEARMEPTLAGWHSLFLLSDLL